MRQFQLSNGLDCKYIVTYSITHNSIDRFPRYHRHKTLKAYMQDNELHGNRLGHLLTMGNKKIIFNTIILIIYSFWYSNYHYQRCKTENTYVTIVQTQYFSIQQRTVFLSTLLVANGNQPQNIRNNGAIVTDEIKNKVSFILY